MQFLKSIPERVRFGGIGIPRGLGSLAVASYTTAYTTAHYTTLPDPTLNKLAGTNSVGLYFQPTGLGCPTCHSASDSCPQAPTYSTYSGKSGMDGEGPGAGQAR